MWKQPLPGRMRQSAEKVYDRTIYAIAMFALVWALRYSNRQEGGGGGGGGGLPLQSPGLQL